MSHKRYIGKPSDTIEKRTLNALLSHYATCPDTTFSCPACRIAKSYAKNISPYKSDFMKREIKRRMEGK